MNSFVVITAENGVVSQKLGLRISGADALSFLTPDLKPSYRDERVCILVPRDEEGIKVYEVSRRLFSGDEDVFGELGVHDKVAKVENFRTESEHWFVSCHELTHGLIFCDAISQEDRSRIFQAMDECLSFFKLSCQKLGKEIISIKKDYNGIAVGVLVKNDRAKNPALGDLTMSYVIGRCKIMPINELWYQDDHEPISGEQKEKIERALLG